MQITGVGGFVPWLPSGPSGPRSAGEPTAPTPATQANQAGQVQTLAAQALQQAEEQRNGGGGGGGGGHGGHAGNKKNNLTAIEELAARASLKIETKEKSPLERAMEIERLKLLANIRAGRVNAKGEGERRGGGNDGRRQPNHQEPDKEATRGEESPAADA